VTPSPPIQAAPFSTAEIYRKTLQSTGWVTVPKNSLFMATGTGALIDAERRLFLTAYHVIEEATEAKIYFPRNDADGRPIAVRNHYLDNERPVIGDVVARDTKRDLVILRLRSLPESVTVLPLAAKGPKSPIAYTPSVIPALAAASGFIPKAPCARLYSRSSA